jgi:hypothetical protein
MASRRRITIAAFAGASLAGAAALVACVIADPPADLPPIQHHRPNIVHGATSPSDGRVLSTWPSQFLVPVEIVDPTSCYQWRVFVDFDPITNPLEVLDNPDETDGKVCPSLATLDGGVDLVDFSLTPPSDTTQCHVVEFEVALSFRGASPHTPDSFGSDSVHWFYNPSGDVGACPTYDAGAIDGAFPPPPDSGVIIVREGGVD